MMLPYFDDLTPLKVDVGNYLVYKLLAFDQRFALGEIGIQFVMKIKGFSKPQAFHLAFKLIEFYEKIHPP
jgi:hypothetical protein